MKHAILLIIIFSNLLFAQIGREELLEKVKARNDLIISKDSKTVEENIYRADYPNGKTTFKNLNIKEEKSSTVSTTTVNVWEIDTTLYQSMYTYWQEV